MGPWRPRGGIEPDLGTEGPNLGPLWSSVTQVVGRMQVFGLMWAPWSLGGPGGSMEPDPEIGSGRTEP